MLTLVLWRVRVQLLGCKLQAIKQLVDELDLQAATHSVSETRDLGYVLCARLLTANGKPRGYSHGSVIPWKT